jgi:hypothetical protein
LYAATVGIKAVAFAGKDAHGRLSLHDPDLQYAVVIEEELRVFDPYVLQECRFEVAEVKGYDGFARSLCRARGGEQVIDALAIDKRRFGGCGPADGYPVTFADIIIPVPDGGHEQAYAACAGYAPEEECEYFFYVYPCGHFVFILFPPNGPADRQTGTTVSVQHGQ